MSDGSRRGGLVPECEWCGHQHEASALCQQRPKWGRRGFLALFGAGLAGSVLSTALPDVETMAFSYGPSEAAMWTQWQSMPLKVGDIFTIQGVFVPNTSDLEEFTVKTDGTFDRDGNFEIAVAPVNRQSVVVLGMRA